MFFFYFFSTLGALLSLYMLIEQDRLLYYKKRGQIKRALQLQHRSSPQPKEHEASIA